MAKVLEKASPALAKPLQPKTSEEFSKARLKLNQAGFRGDTSPEVYWSLKMIGLVVGFVVGGGAMVFTKGLNIDSLTYAGAIGGVMSWVGGPSRGLLETAKNGEIPPFMAKVNKKGMQVVILIIQGIIVSILTSLYFIMDNVSVAFFVLSAITITLYLVMYILMYLSAIKLRFTQPDLPRSYKVPGGKIGMCLVAGVGLLGVCFSLLVGFFPPSNLPVGNPVLYVGTVASAMIVFVGLPLLIHAMKKPQWRQGPEPASSGSHGDTVNQ